MSRKRKKLGRNLTQKREIAKYGDARFERLSTGGMIVYGTGDHLKDMLAWHDDLADRIVKVVDKDKAKIGKKAPGLTCKVESPEVLKSLPAGTWVVVSALRYYDEIVNELHELNPGLVCPDIDKTYTLLRQAEAKGLLVYGVGAHLADMLSWYPELKGRIGRIFDKDKSKQGTQAPGTDNMVEGLDELKRLPAGTQIAVSAIRYLHEIAEEVYALNPGLICQNIDDAYRMLPSALVQKTEFASEISDYEVAGAEHAALNNLQGQRLRGKAAAERWRRKFLMESANVRKVFWGTKGVRAFYLCRAFQSFMGKRDIFIDEDLSLRGKLINGLPVCIPEVLKDIREEFVVIVLSDAYDEVSKRLRNYGYVENVNFVEGRQLLGEDENGYIDMPCIDNEEV